jgi:cytochrome c-type biogenesis protein CcmH/NrfG
MGRHSRHLAEIPAGYWKAGQAYMLAVITLMLGIAIGYLFRGSSSAAGSGNTVGGFSSANAGLGSVQSPSLPLSSTVEPLLQRLKINPNDPELLANIGNQYYDSREYGTAVEYYEKSLKLRPENVSVRTDMGTAIWYSGDPDRAIREYEASLKYQPNHAQTLFNMGIVKWQGKQDRKAALELWRKLLAVNPGYSDRQKVEQIFQQVQAEVR